MKQRMHRLGVVVTINGLNLFNLRIHLLEKPVTSAGKQTMCGVGTSKIRYNFQTHEFLYFLCQFKYSMTGNKIHFKLNSLINQFSNIKNN